MSYTVVPLHNLELPSSPITFAGSFVLQPVPDWVKKDSTFTQLRAIEQDGVHWAKSALVAEYEAGAIGEQDTTWKGSKPKSIQNVKVQQAITANLAIWLAQPSPVGFELIFHALSWNFGEANGLPPSIMRTNFEPRLLCHPADEHKRPSIEQLIEAAGLHTVLLTIPRGNVVWTAIRSFWAGLILNERDVRHLLFWVAIEALFGPQDGGEITHKLAQRIAFFISNDRDSAKKFFKTAKQCYAMRSKIAHGRWKDDPGMDFLIGQTETIFRKALLRLLREPSLMNIFLGKEREEFLDELPFSHVAT
jgi:hypothetical protein